MKTPILIICVLASLALACNLSAAIGPATEPPVPPQNTLPAATAQVIEPATPTPEIFIPLTQAVPGQAEATALPEPTIPAPLPTAIGIPVAAGPLSLVLPPGLASGVSLNQYPRAEGDSLPEWGATPGHSVISLDGYPLQGKFHQPQIVVFPAMAYVEMLPAAFESIHRLDNILYGPAGVSLSAGPLPTVPFFNAQQVFASNLQAVSFQNGSGVRFLTEYAQYPAPANNHDLFYHFQGLTRDGASYIIAILPVSVPVLAETSDPGAVLPPGGVPYTFYADPNTDMQAYYAAITTLLDSTPSQAFTPSLDELDALIQTMQVNP